MNDELPTDADIPEPLGGMTGTDAEVEAIRTTPPSRGMTLDGTYGQLWRLTDMYSDQRDTLIRAYDAVCRERDEARAAGWHEALDEIENTPYSEHDIWLAMTRLRARYPRPAAKEAKR